MKRFKVGIWTTLNIRRKLIPSNKKSGSRWVHYFWWPLHKPFQTIKEKWILPNSFQSQCYWHLLQGLKIARHILHARWSRSTFSMKWLPKFLPNLIQTRLCITIDCEHTVIDYRISCYHSLVEFIWNASWRSKIQRTGSLSLISGTVPSQVLTAVTYF